MRFRPIWLVGLFPIVILVSRQAWFEDWQDFAAPPVDPAIQQLAQKSRMTPIAERLFYRQRPTIESKDTFLEQCKVPDKSIMLGCFVRRGHRGKIVIQNITDARLKGTMEVTAAHEMLHAAYERLSGHKRQELAQRLTKAANRIQDPRLKAVLDDYAARDRELYYNELHSHLGTELANLGDASLEQHYQRYFHDRRQVVALAQKSGAVLKQLDDEADTLKPKITQLETELKQLEPQIKASEADLKASQQNLESLESTLLTTKAEAEAAFQAESPQAIPLAAQFEQQKAQFNQAVDQHNDRAEIQRNRIANFNTNVKAYKALIGKYNKVARESHSILDSLATPPPPTQN
jgi:predicted  nucleic acid-binding Zn-ribbon protein